MTNRMSAKQYQNLKPKKRNKFNACKVVYDGHKFDSKAECSRYVNLQEWQEAGAISRLKVHPKYRLAVNGELIKIYTADFRYIDNKTRKMVVEDVKSPATARLYAFVMTRKLFKAIYGFEITIIQ